MSHDRHDDSKGERERQEYQVREKVLEENQIIRRYLVTRKPAVNRHVFTEMSCRG